MKNSKDPNEPRTPTEAQIDANRENAKKSTGPRSPEGKAASSRNRLLHGLRANKHILIDEDPEDFLMLLKDLHDRFQPVGDAEESLVLRIASAHWRLDRAFPMEASLYRNRLREVAEEDAEGQRIYARQKEIAEFQGAPVPPAPAPHDQGDSLARAFDADCVAPNSLARLARYEGSIERSIDRCLRQLKTYQAARIASTPDPGHLPSPEVEQAVPPAEPAATPSETTNYHSNPKNGGIAQFMVYTLLHAVPEFIAALASLLVGQALGLRRPPRPPGRAFNNLRWVFDRARVLQARPFSANLAPCHTVIT
jgi:hypothetical protein